MTIEFSCQHCGKALSTSDDKAGRKAKCPQCGEVIQVPELETAEMATEADEEGLAPPLPGEQRMKNCPMCGERVPASAKKCEFCGEELFSEPEATARGHRVIEAGKVLGTSWEIFKKDMGLVIGGMIVFNLLNFAVQLPQNIMNGVAGALEAQGDKDSAMVCQIIGLLFFPLSIAGQMFFQVGMFRFVLNIVRGDVAQIGDLFTGAKFFWRMLGASILFGLMVFAGTLACIIPGIILALMFAPYGYVLVDEDPPGIECLSRARAATKDNLGTLFVVALAMIGVNILGMLALCVGLIFTIPLTTLYFAVAYCQMTGQRTAA